MSKFYCLLCVLFLFAGPVACNNSNTSLTSSYQFCAYQNIYSDTQFANNSSLFPTFDDAVVVKLRGTGEINTIHYRISQAASFFLSLNSEKVNSVSLEDLNGNVKASLANNQTSSSLTLEAGDYLLKIQGNNKYQDTLVIQPGGCSASVLNSKLALSNSISSTYSHPGVYINEISFTTTLLPASTNTTAFIGAVPQGTLNQAVSITSWNEYTQNFGSIESDYPLSAAVYTFFNQGGERAYVLGVSNEVSPPSVSELVAGLDGLDSVSSLNLYVFPDLMNLSTSDASQLAQSAVPVVNEREGILILDPPMGMESPQQIINFVEQDLADLPLQNTVLYFPYITMINPFTQQNYTLGAGGIMAGDYANTDNNEGVWAAPANDTLSGVTALSDALTESEMSQLDELGINSFRSLEGRGIVVWGAKTLSQSLDEEYKYINLRRLYFFIQQSISLGLEWVVFEANDSSLWASMTSNVSNFMNILWQEGALMGSSASEAYQVTCPVGNIAENILNGFVEMEVNYQTVDPAQFTVINFSFEVQGD